MNPERNVKLNRVNIGNVSQDRNAGKNLSYQCSHGSTDYVLTGPPRGFVGPGGKYQFSKLDKFVFPQSSLVIVNANGMLQRVPTTTQVLLRVKKRERKCYESKSENANLLHEPVLYCSRRQRIVYPILKKNGKNGGNDNNFSNNSR